MTANEVILKAAMLPLGIAANWEAAKTEWRLDRVEEVGDGYDCMCSKKNIHRLCHMRNAETENTAVVGSCCVEKFLDQRSGLIFDCLKRLRKKPESAMNATTLSWEVEKGFLTEWEEIFYADTQRKRKLSEKQEAKRTQINRKFLQKISKND
jgi:hypothetical protein